ncbi:DNA repair protein REV1 [Bacillus rossius redtenbacheri]|uniref:DNA repair protein REV1 n=1 Tax=Bacillus rossius redtenbacheri TaxID=93214 RepID=UPI002FDD3A62
MKGRRNDDSEDNGFAKWGGYMAAKKSKLEQQFSANPRPEADGGGIFAGVAIFVNGYTRPTAEELKQLMLRHGGTYHHYRSRATTHVIAANLPDSKVRQLKGTDRVVRPEWVAESVAAGRLLDHRDYLLCPARPCGQARLGFPPAVPAPARLASDDNFLEEFYSNSRLHHISTMGAAFKQYVGELRAAGRGSFPGLERLQAAGRHRDGDDGDDDLFGEPGSAPGDRVIMHVDMDCFFVSVGLRARPHLRGLPVAVTHARGEACPCSPGRAETRQQERECYRQRLKERLGEQASVPDDAVPGGSMSEVASCSYEARRAGVTNGMLLGAALALCPALRTMPYDFEGYQEVARALYDTVAEYTLDIEAVSCDEMFVDCTELLRRAEVTPLEFATVLRREIRERTGCTASTGLGPSPLLARLATRRAKPDGQFLLEASEAEGFLRDVAVGDLPGVGRSVASRLAARGVSTCGQLQKLSLAALQAQFGARTGLALHRHCRGVDDRELHTSGQHRRKSVSAEVNYGIRLADRGRADAFLRRLAGEVAGRLAALGLAGRSVALKLMVRAKDAPVETAKFLGHGVCDNVTRSSSLAAPVADAEAIAREVLGLARQIAAPPAEWRGVGIQVSRLEARTAPSHGLERFLAAPRGSEEPRPSTDRVVTLSQVDPSFLEALPDDVRQEVEASLARGGRDSAEELSTDMPLREAETVLREWARTQRRPEPYDIYLLADYAERLAALGRADTLLAVLRLLRECTAHKQDDAWREACQSVEDCAQETMLRVHGEELAV